MLPNRIIKFSKIGLLAISPFLSSVSVWSQSSSDSLKKLITRASVDTTLARLYYELGTAVYVAKPDSAKLYWAKTVKLISEQTTEDKAESRRLKLLSANAINNLGIVAEKLGNNSEALTLYKESLQIRRQADDVDGILTSLTNLGIYFRKQGHAEAAMRNYKEALTIAENANDKPRVLSLLVNLGVLYQTLDFTKAATDYYHEAIAIAKELDSKQEIGRICNGLGGIHMHENRPDSALHYFGEAVKIRKELNDLNALSIVYMNISQTHFRVGRLDSAETYINICLQLKHQLNDKAGMAVPYSVASSIARNQNNLQKAVALGNTAMAYANSTKIPTDLESAADALYEVYRLLGDSEKSLEMLEIKMSISDSLKIIENGRMLLQEKFKMDYERIRISDSLEFVRQKEVQDLVIAKTNAQLRLQRIGLFSAAGILALIGLLAYAIYTGKRKSDRLLLNILPVAIAGELKKFGRSKARRHEAVTVIFTDFKSFTELTSQMNPEELVAELDYCFSEFDRIVAKHNIEKIKTIGDAYMAVSGLPIPLPDHAHKAALAALEMMYFMKARKAQCDREGKQSFELRIGLHTGPVVAGIVGQKKFQYDVWGDTVNTASRMESASEPGRINASETTFTLLRNQFEWACRGPISVKGKGPIPMYFLNGTV